LQEAETLDFRQYYQHVAAGLGRLFGGGIVTVWAVSEIRDSISALAVWPPETPIQYGEYSLTNIPHKIAVERREPVILDLRKEKPCHDYGYCALEYPFPAVIEHKKLALLSLPIFNTNNINHVRYLVHVAAEVPAGGDVRERFEGIDLTRLGTVLGRSADAYLNDFCGTASAEAGRITAQTEILPEFLNRTRKLIQELLRAQGCTIFLANHGGNRLEAAVGDPHWFSASRFYEINDGSFTTKVWLSKEPLITGNLRTERGGKGAAKSEEPVPSDEDYCLFAPILDPNGTPAGVVRCRNQNRIPGKPVQPFTADDLAILDAILQVVVPRLLHLRADERRRSALRRTAHELKMPLTAIRGALDNIREELEFRVRHHKMPRLNKDYIGDALGWSDLMVNLLRRTDYIEIDSKRNPLRLSRVNVRTQILFPTKRQLKSELKARWFSQDQIVVNEANWQLPRLWVDKNMFQQIVFNLLQNAIKYAKRDQNSKRSIPEEFHVEIDGFERNGAYVLRFRDNGIGISSGMKEAIFEEGVRGDDVAVYDVEGQGFGLAIVRRLVQLHGGKIEVTKLENPTEFTIELPARLAGPWSPEDIERTGQDHA